MSVVISTLAWQSNVTRHTDLLVLIAMADGANDEGVLWWGLTKLADKVRMHVDSLRKVVRRLENDGHLTTKPRVGKSSIYVVHPRPKAGGMDDPTPGGKPGDPLTHSLGDPLTHSLGVIETSKKHQTTVLKAREAELIDCLGRHANQRANANLLILSEPINWLAGGCDFDLDILPVVKALSERANSIRDWRYFRDAVFEARDRRTADTPKPNSSNQTARPSSRKMTAGQKAREMAIAARERENAQH